MCFVALVVSPSVVAQSEEMFSIYLVRHSEKDLNSEHTSDLPLSECGEQRSAALSNFLDDVHLDAVYSTDYTRTLNTALPSANDRDLNITLYNTQDLELIANMLLESRQNALVVGHSNTTGVLAGLLVNQEIGDINLDIYDRIYQVVISGESSQLQMFHSAFECVQ